MEKVVGAVVFHKDKHAEVKSKSVQRVKSYGDSCNLEIVLFLAN